MTDQVDKKQSNHAAEVRAVEVIRKCLGPYASGEKIIGALSLAGLKIVEK